MAEGAELRARSLPQKAWRYLRDPQVALWRKLSAVGALAYVVWPWDALPDMLPVIGWLDDLGVLGAVTFFMLREIRRHAERAASPD